MTIVFKISDNLKPKLIKYYEDLKKDKTPPYAVFQAQEADTTITLYESGKVMFQGVSADIDANIWIDLEKKLNNRIIDPTGKEKNKEKKDIDYHFNNYNTLGSDEVGTGDYFGPIVVSAAYVERNMQSFLLDLKVGDSKKLSDEKILEIAPLIIEKIPYTTFIIKNNEYNKTYNNELNMNKIKAIMHNKVLLSMLEKNIKPDKIIVDQFENPKAYFNHLNQATKIVKNITFVTKAEDKALSVACASIISRYVFLIEMSKLESDLGSVVPKGAGEQVDAFATSIAKEKGIDYLANYVKLNFKNTDKIKEKLN